VEKIAVGFRGMGFVVRVRGFGEMKINYIIFVWNYGGNI